MNTNDIEVEVYFDNLAIRNKALKLSKENAIKNVYQWNKTEFNLITPNEVKIGSSFMANDRLYVVTKIRERGITTDEYGNRMFMVYSRIPIFRRKTNKNKDYSEISNILAKNITQLYKLKTN